MDKSIQMDEKYLAKFTDWSDFIAVVNQVIQDGFNDDNDFITKIGFDKETYNKVGENIISNWVDSITKSLLHYISDYDVMEMPKPGASICRDYKSQLRLLTISGSGYNQRNIFGTYDNTSGLRMIPSTMMLDAIPNPKPELGERFLKHNGVTLLYVKKDAVLVRLNLVLQYVWVYRLLQHIKIQKVKLPKILYRGVRGRVEPILDKAKAGNLTYNDVLEDNYMSFSSVYNVSKKFADSDGYVLSIDTNEVIVIACALTDDILASKNHITNVYEKEYIVKVKDRSKKISLDNIHIEAGDYYRDINSPLFANYIDHDVYVVRYEIENGSDTYDIEYKGYWASNTQFSKHISFDDFHGNVRDFVKRFGFNPLPTKNNLDKIKNFKIFRRDYSGGKLKQLNID